MRCQHKSCTHTQLGGKALCLFLEYLHRNGVRHDSPGSVPHLLLARPQLKGSLDPLDPCKVLPAQLAHKDASWCRGNSLASSFPPQLYQSTQIKPRLVKMTWAPSPEGLCKRFQPRCRSRPSLRRTATQPSKALPVIHAIQPPQQVNQEKAALRGKICSSWWHRCDGKGENREEKGMLKKSIRMGLCFV